MHTLCSGDSMRKPRVSVVEILLYNMAALLSGVAASYDVRMSNVSPVHPVLQLKSSLNENNLNPIETEFMDADERKFGQNTYHGPSRHNRALLTSISSTISTTSGLDSNFTTNTSGLSSSLGGSTQPPTPSPRRKTSTSSFTENYQDYQEVDQQPRLDNRAPIYVPGDYLNRYPSTIDGFSVDTGVIISNYIFKFTGVIEVIDGSHIYIKAPKDHLTSYVNRRGRHSIILQGFCNEKKKFIDVYGGECNDPPDANVLKRSDVFKRIQDGNIRLPPDCHLVGDSAYQLLTSLMVPYKNNGHLERKHKNYKRALSKAGVVIGNTFELLKMRFRRLNLNENRKLDFIAMIVITCCILHIICTELHDIPTEEIISNENGMENNINDIQINN